MKVKLSDIIGAIEMTDQDWIVNLTIIHSSNHST